MKLKALLFLILTAVLPLAAPRTAEARADVSFDYFYDALLPYGEWIEVTGYGYCWRPTDADAGWAPFSDGYWAFTDAGWTWVGYEEFAGIVYHYGRWVNVEDVGWCWVPDYEWGPGWVSWRNSDDYIGWAPLPPRAYWQPEIGISTWVDTVCDTGPAFYSFCRVRDFGAPVLSAVIINRTRNVTIIRNTVNITNITYNTYGDSPVIYNGGPSYVFISSRCERPIPALKLVRHTHFDRQDFHGGPGRFSPNARTVGNQLIVNAPIVAPPERPAFLQDKVKRVFAADKVANGWAGVKDGKVRDDLRQGFQRETKGLTPYTAPAKAVVAADLKVVPAQADPNAVPPVFTGRGARGNGDRQPPVITGSPVVPGQPAKPVADTTKPPAVTNPAVTTPGQDKVIDPRAAEKIDHPKMGRENAKNPGAVAPPDAPVEPAKAAREQANIQQQKLDAEKLRATPAEIEKAKADQERLARQREADANAAGMRQKQAADAAAAGAEKEKTQAQQQQRAAQVERDKLQADQARMSRQREADATAATQQKQLEAQRQAEAAKQAEAKRQQLEAQGQERQRQQQEQAAAQRRQQQMEAQHAAQDTARQQAAERAREQQMEQQRAAQDAAKQQAAEQARQQQMEQQRAAQDAARQQAAEQQRRGMDAQREQAARQQAEAQRAAQQRASQAPQPAPQQPAPDGRRGEKEKDKDKDKGR